MLCENISKYIYQKPCQPGSFVDLVIPPRKESPPLLCIILYEAAFIRSIGIPVMFVPLLQVEFKTLVFFGYGSIIKKIVSEIEFIVISYVSQMQVKYPFGETL